MERARWLGPPAWRGSGSRTRPVLGSVPSEETEPGRARRSWAAAPNPGAPPPSRRLSVPLRCARVVCHPLELCVAGEREQQLKRPSPRPQSDSLRCLTRSTTGALFKVRFLRSSHGLDRPRASRDAAAPRPAASTMQRVIEVPTASERQRTPTVCDANEVLWGITITVNGGQASRH